MNRGAHATAHPADARLPVASPRRSGTARFADRCSGWRSKWIRWNFDNSRIRWHSSSGRRLPMRSSRHACSSDFQMSCVRTGFPRRWCRSATSSGCCSCSGSWRGRGREKGKGGKSGELCECEGKQQTSMMRECARRWTLILPLRRNVRASRAKCAANKARAAEERRRQQRHPRDC